MSNDFIGFLIFILWIVVLILSGFNIIDSVQKKDARGVVIWGAVFVIALILFPNR